MDQPNNLPVSTTPSRTRSFNYCASRLMLTLVTSFLILSCVSVIAWLVIDPQDPTFRLDSLSLSNITMSDSEFAANYDMDFSVNNTNKKPNLVIDHVRVVVFYRKAMVSQKVLDETSIYVPKMSHETLKIALDGDSARPIKNRVFKNLSDDWRRRKIMSLSVEMFIRTRYELGAWPTKRRFFHIWCTGVTVEYVSTKGIGKLMSAGKDCSIRLV